MNTFGLVAGMLAGVGVASLVHPRRALGHAGVLGVFLAAAAMLLFVPTVAERVDARFAQTWDLAAAAPVLQRLLLIAAVAAWTVHLLGLLRTDVRITRGTVAVAVLSAAALIWQWLTFATSPMGAFTAEMRWYHLAFAVGIGISQLVVAVMAARRRSPGLRWPMLLLVAAIAGIGWCLWLTVPVFVPNLAGTIPAWAGWLLLGASAIGYWWGSVEARQDRSEEPQVPGEALDELDDDEGDESATITADDADDADAAVTDEPAAELATLPLAQPSRVTPPEADLETLQKNAAMTAVALARQLEKAGRGSAVAVGVSGDKLVFVTPDGLGFLPEGGAGSADLVPLILVVPPEFVTKWLGCAHPQMPLLAAAELGHIPPLQAVASVNAAGTLSGIDLEGEEDIEPAKLKAPRSRTDSVPISDAHNLLSDLQAEWDIEPGAPTAQLAAAVTGARWTTWPNPEYPRSWVAELIARATADFQDGDIDSAQYCLASASRVPLPSQPVALPMFGHTADQTPDDFADPTYQDEGFDDAVVIDDSDAAVAADPVPVVTPQVPTNQLSVSIVASLSDQIPGNAHIAVAVAADGTAVFATSDGLGYLPHGALTSNSVVPLASRVDVAFAANWFGCDAPHLTLLAAAQQGLIPQIVDMATTSQETSTVGVISISDSTMASAPRIALTVPREHYAAADLDDEELDRILEALTGRLGPAGDVIAARTAAESQRWTGAPGGQESPLYALAWARYLQAEATAMRHTPAVGYLVSNAVLAEQAAAFEPAAEH